MPRLVFWRVDDALILLIPFSLSVLFGSLLLMIAGFVSVSAYRKIRKRSGGMNFKTFLYWRLGAGFSKVPSHMRIIRR
jgi:hypothetical protein